MRYDGWSPEATTTTISDTIQPYVIRDTTLQYGSAGALYPIAILYGVMQ